VAQGLQHRTPALIPQRKTRQTGHMASLTTHPAIAPAGRGNACSTFTALTGYPASSIDRPRSRTAPRPRRPGGRLRYRPAQEGGNGEAFCPAAAVPNERSRPARTAAARAAPPQSGGQRRQNPGGALRKLAAFAGPKQSRTRPGPGCRRPRPRAGRPCRTRRKIENSLVNSLFSGNLPGPHQARTLSRRLWRQGARPDNMGSPFRRHARACRGHGEVAQYDRNAL
jgi:hypothetical protein